MRRAGQEKSQEQEKPRVPGAAHVFIFSGRRTVATD
jgi:hypothetical protein